MFIEPLTKVGMLAGLTTLFARVQIPAAHLASVRVEAPVDVRVIALPGLVFKGTVSRLGKRADLQTGNVEAFASFPSNTGDLRPGLKRRRCPSRMTMARPKKAIPAGAGSGDPKRFDNFSRPITACRAAISLVLGGLDLRRNIRSPGAAVIFALADMLDSGSQPFIQQVYLSSAATGLMMESRSHTNNPALPTVRIIGVRTLDELLQLVWPGLIQANHAGRLD